MNRTPERAAISRSEAVLAPVGELDEGLEVAHAVSAGPGQVDHAGVK
ncbi:hypothetical protein [Novosphingobium sp. THN1]|nr:hypothetical protein [Novosphingobium sp. THN1]